jgi:hypothetical protein
MTTENKTIVCFHIGRGGKFHNAGHKSYLSYTKPSQLVEDDSKHWFFINPENYYDVKMQLGDRPNLLSKFDECSDKNDFSWFEKKGFEMGKDYYFDANGNALVSVQEVESGIFSINHDNEYDTNYSCYLENCDERELELIIKADCDNVEEAKQLLINNFDRTDLIEENEATII